ncbi:hypothetical protein F2Q65_07175 [Thiohalocapsa marina]|uniref:Uncharacterized protein n=1 Tax=Thiohalocapsa marina TaxID=424902 RepID=A0A5M8FM18_9GAMM|nr:hypothetical protein F2Q65_07175 [Thiohalocapsa marina]
MNTISTPGSGVRRQSEYGTETAGIGQLAGIVCLLSGGLLRDCPQIRGAFQRVRLPLPQR